MAKEDSFTPYEELLREANQRSPWGPSREFLPDLGLLERLVEVPLRMGAVSPSGRFPKAFDVWVAHELRRAGFEYDEVWPRPVRPRILPADIQLMLDRIPAVERETLVDFMANDSKASAFAPVDARVLGRVYTKQADVLIASWKSGVELLVSTKTMVSSYGNNLRNRFEESYGDAINLRGRFPLAALGFLFAVRSDIPEKDLVFLSDMLSKLREPSGYDGCCLLVVEWTNESGPVTVRSDMAADDLGPQRFVSDLVNAVLQRTPVDHHVGVRARLANAASALFNAPHDPSLPGGTE